MDIEDADVDGVVDMFIALSFLTVDNDDVRRMNKITPIFKHVIKFGLHLFGDDVIRRIISDNGDNVDTVQSCVATDIANLALCGITDAEYAYAELIYLGVYDDNKDDKDDAEVLFERALGFWRSARDKNHKLAFNRCKLWAEAGRWRCRRSKCGQIFRRSPLSFGFFCSGDCLQMHKLDKVVDDILMAQKMRRLRKNLVLTPNGMRIPCCFRSN
tara:strand:- start:164 stop:805 length:642 start_codon:yes stop_codon:yes gene_type:complete